MTIGFPDISRRRNATRRGLIGILMVFTAVAMSLPAGAEFERCCTTNGSLIAHVHVAEQTTLTPVPIWLEISQCVAVARVQVMYLPFGTPRWKTLDLARSGQGWGGYIPCADVSTITGDMRYYILAYNASGEIIARVGSEDDPIDISIVLALGGIGPPHLPNQPPPDRCADVSDCPPSLPGCPRDPSEPLRCSSDSDCENGESCTNLRECERIRRPNWLSLALEQDAGIVSALNACTTDTQQMDNTTCIRQVDGARYRGSPLSDGGVATRVGIATSRVSIGWDRVLTPSLMAGVRLGYAFRGSAPSSVSNAFLPIQFEARASYWFGQEPFNRHGFRPFVFVGGGIAQVDVPITSTVRENVDATTTQGGNDINQRLDVWKRAGRSFGGIGSGVVYATSPGRGLTADLKILQLFPALSTVLALEVGYVVGF